MIKYIFWDHDNTIVVSRELHWQKHKFTLASLGLKLMDTPENRQHIYHNNGEQNWHWLTRLYGSFIPLNDYLTRIDDYYRSHLSTLACRSGIRECLQIARDKKMIQSIVSNGRKNSVLPTLEALGIRSYFEVIVCKEDYQDRKPSADSYNMARQLLETQSNHKIDPDNCLAIEDDPFGIEAAAKAGFHVLQRKLDPEDTNHPLARYHVFEEEDFTQLFSSLVQE
jgi:HAD superfamily hydrolase (TIGR01509 family)